MLLDASTLFYRRKTLGGRSLKLRGLNSTSVNKKTEMTMVDATQILDANILIVDDQASNVRMLKQLLAEVGYLRVSSTMDPTDVCALHRKNGYDLILLDLQMPGMDGFQVMEALKTNDADSYLPVIVLTAQPGHKLQALQAGAKDFISKPLDLVEVKMRIYNMLGVLKRVNSNEHRARQVVGFQQMTKSRQGG